jgi:hypothetical protein
MINEQWVGKDMEGSGRLPGGTEENYEILSQDSLSPGRNLYPGPPD